jgi:hypothetical protein
MFSRSTRRTSEPQEIRPLLEQAFEIVDIPWTRARENEVSSTIPTPEIILCKI